MIINILVEEKFFEMTYKLHRLLVQVNITKCSHDHAIVLGRLVFPIVKHEFGQYLRSVSLLPFDYHFEERILVDAHGVFGTRLFEL